MSKIAEGLCYGNSEILIPWRELCWKRRDVLRDLWDAWMNVTGLCVVHILKCYFRACVCVCVCVHMTEHLQLKSGW